MGETMPAHVITRKPGHEIYSVREGAGASSRTISRPPVDAECARLIAASKAALAQFDQATASGSPSAIGAARAELLRLKTALELAKVDALFAGAMSKALARPMRMGE
jgi:hypothetical protein